MILCNACQVCFALKCIGHDQIIIEILKIKNCLCRLKFFTNFFSTPNLLNNNKLGKSFVSTKKYDRKLIKKNVSIE